METLHCRWDTRAAVLTGDYLLARAFDLLSTLEQKERCCRYCPAPFP